MADFAERTQPDSSSLLDEAPTLSRPELKEPIKVDFSKTHPLENHWTLYFDNPGKSKVTQKDWMANLHDLTTVTTVEEFWCLYNNLRRPSELPVGSNYHLFKKGIQPMWEDTENKQGGKWILTFPRKNSALLDVMWLKAALSIIGEQFERNDEVNGVVLSIRKQDKISVWTKSADDEAAALSIGRELKELLGLPAMVSIGYQAHSDSLRRGSSFNNRNRYTA